MYIVQSNQAANVVVESKEGDEQEKSVNVESGGVEKTSCAESTSDRSNAVADVGNIGVETATCADSTLDQSNATVTN